VIKRYTNLHLLASDTVLLIFWAGVCVHFPFIIIIIINEEIVVAFSPRTTRTRYRVKKKQRS